MLVIDLSINFFYISKLKMIMPANSYKEVFWTVLREWRNWQTRQI